MRAGKSFFAVGVLAVLALVGYLLWTLLVDPGETPDSGRRQDPAVTEEKAMPPSVGDESNPVIATVGPLEIRLKDLTDLSAASEAGARKIREATATDRPLLQIRQRFLEAMIERRLLVLEAAKHPEWVTDASWEAEVQRTLVEVGPDELERRRILAGIPQEEFFADLRKHVREEMMKTEILKREIDANLEVTEEELKQRYESDRESHYFRPQAWGIHQFARIVSRTATSDPTESKRQVERIRERVASAITSATDPRGMARIMKETLPDLIDPAVDQVGDAYVYDTPEAQFDPALKSHLGGCVVGDLSPVFELAGDPEHIGYCFYLPYSHQPAEQAPFDRVKRVLRGRIREEKKKESTNRLFERLKREFPVEIRSELLDLDPPN